jgi:hypothetical protein
MNQPAFTRALDAINADLAMLSKAKKILEECLKACVKERIKRHAMAKKIAGQDYSPTAPDCVAGNGVYPCYLDGCTVVATSSEALKRHIFRAHSDN